MASGKEYNLKTVLSCVDRLSPTLAKVQKSYAGVANSMKVMNRAAANVGRELSSFASSVMAPVSLAMGVLGVSVGASTKAFASYADKLDAVATKSGVTTKSLQQLRYAASVNGSSAETMDAALVKLNKTMADAAAGKNKEAALLFKTLGINLKDSNGHIRTAADVLPELAEAFRLNRDPALRTRMAMDLFGKSGADLIPLLSQGSGNLKEMAKRAEELGLTVSDDAVKAGGQLNNTFTELNQSMNATVGEITKSLAPVIKDIAEKFMTWCKNNREVISVAIADWLKKLGEAIKSVDWDLVIRGLEFLAGAALAVKLSSLASTLINLGKAVTAATGPWGLLIAAVMVTAGFIARNWDRITELTERMGKEIGKIFTAMGKDLEETVNRCISWIKSLIPDDLKKFFEDAWNTITGVFQTAIDKITALFPDWLKKWFSNGSKEIVVTQEQMPHVKPPPGYSNGEDDSDDYSNEGDEDYTVPPAKPAEEPRRPAVPVQEQKPVYAAQPPSQPPPQPQNLVQPNPAGMQMSAAGRVTGKVDINLTTSDGQTQKVEAPVTGGVRVSGNAGEMRSTDYMDPYVEAVVP